MNEETDRNELLALWLSGAASAADERALDIAAASDPALAAELASHRDTLARLRALPLDREPERDLFPEIARRAGLATTQRSGGDAAPIGARRARTVPRSRAFVRLALAASLLAALALGWSLRARIESAPVVVEVPAPRAATPPASTMARTAYAATGRELDAIRDELRQSIDRRRDALPPETRRLVFENLATIDRAIAEIEAALAAAPTDSELARTYIAYRQRQIDLLRHANRLAARL